MAAVKIRVYVADGYAQIPSGPEGKKTFMKQARYMGATMPHQSLEFSLAKVGRTIHGKCRLIGGWVVVWYAETGASRR